MGDFNIDVLNDQDPTTKRFADLLRSFGLKWSINSPTRVTATSKTAIDNIITNIPDVDVSVVNTAISDHYGQEATVGGYQLQLEPPTRRKIRDTRPENIAILNSYLATEDWDFLNFQKSPEQQFQLFYERFIFHVNTCCPVKEIKVQQKKVFHCKWITKGILVSREKLKFFSEINSQTVNLDFKSFFKRYKQTYRKVIKAAKSYEIMKSIQNAKNVSKTAWTIINNQKSTTPPKEIKVMVDGEVVSDPFRVAEAFNNFFAHVAPERGPCPSQFQPTTVQSPVSSVVLAPVTEEEVDKIIQQLSSKRSNDINLLSVWLIKKCSRHILSPISKLVNLSFETGTFPSALKTAIVTPIFKNGDPSCISNFRPISILPALSKIYEKLFLIRVIDFLEKHNLLSKDQFGFRRGKSTTDAVVSLVEMIVEGLESRKPTLSVFLDLSKAFDCVDHRTLLQKLNSHGVRGVALSWIKSYLTDRIQIVHITNQHSNTQTMSNGVPQGSILSPLLFLIYVNDIGSSLQHGHLVQYADDTTLCFNANSEKDLEIQAFVELNSCVQAFNDINLETNSSKTNFINFKLSPRDPECSPAVMLSDTMLEEAFSTKFLGIYLDQGLTWNNHVDTVCSKLSSGIYVLRSLSKYCPTQILMTAYYGLIYPHLSYGVALWGASSNANLLRVFTLQKKAIRIIIKLKQRESCKQAFKDLQLLTLPSLYILETITFCMSKCALTRGSDIHSHETRGRNYYRTGQHRTVVHARLPSQAGCNLVNNLPNVIKSATVPKAFRNRLKHFLTSQAFYSVGEFMAQRWETTETNH